MYMETKKINASDKEKIRKGKELLDNYYYDEAREIFMEYAHTFGPCAFWLGCMYEFGEGVEKDDAIAAQWYQTAAEFGEKKACYNLALAYWWGRSGVEQDKAKALKYYAVAAEIGDANAQFQMGYAYFHGIGVEKNVEDGLKWFEKAAEQNHHVAQYNLGRFYLFYAPAEMIDKSKGFEYMVSSADSGYTDAEVVMGYLYSQGIGAEQDFLWWQRTGLRRRQIRRIRFHYIIWNLSIIPGVME